jgi:hypothetical protein
MKVIPCLELAAGKCVKIGDILIIGVKKAGEKIEPLMLESDKITIEGAV